MISALITLIVILFIVFIAASIIKFAAKFLLKLGIFALIVFVILHLLR